jgi:two-component system CheB/CheR fusion protein
MDLAGNAVPPRRRRILIVEDNVDDVYSLARLLRDDGHQVNVALSGIVGFDQAKQFEPEVILLDIGLPDISGLTLARLLRTNPRLKHSHIIAITGRDLSEPEAKAAGVDCVLSKPVDYRVLERLLSDVRPEGRVRARS